MKFCVIYDLDGTLIDSRGDLTAAINAMRSSYGLPPISLNKVTSFIGNGARKLVARAIAGHNIDLDEALTRNKQFYATHKTIHTILYPGVKQCLKTIQQAGIPQAVVTNKHHEAVEEILEHFDILQYFHYVIGGGSGFPLKPAPDALRHIVDKSGCSAAASWMVGDHYTDLQAGREAGLKRCHAAYGFGNIKDESFDLEVDNLADFASAILQSSPPNE